MPTKDKRAYVILDLKLLTALGLDATIEGDVGGPALRGAVARYCELIPQAANDCVRAFPNRATWELLADALRETARSFPCLNGDMPAHMACAEAVRAAHRERNIGLRWLVSTRDRGTLTADALQTRADDRVRQIADELWNMRPEHGAAVLAGVRWYWAHKDDLDATLGDWWVPRERAKSYARREEELSALKVKPHPAAPPPTVQPSLFEEESDRAQAEPQGREEAQEEPPGARDG